MNNRKLNLWKIRGQGRKKGGGVKRRLRDCLRIGRYQGLLDKNKGVKNQKPLVEDERPSSV